MSNENNNQSKNLNEFYDAVDNIAEIDKSENKQETLAPTTMGGTGTVTSCSNMQYGWICPKCGKVLAPWKDSCNCYLNIPYIPPNTTPINPTPEPYPFNPAPHWKETPQIGDAPGWWQYTPKCGEPIPCGGSVGPNDDATNIQIYNSASTSTANTDSPDIAAIKAMSEVVHNNISTPLKDLDRALNDKLNFKITNKI